MTDKKLKAIHERQHNLQLMHYLSLMPFKQFIYSYSHYNIALKGKNIILKTR